MRESKTSRTLIAAACGALLAVPQRDVHAQQTTAAPDVVFHIRVAGDTMPVRGASLTLDRTVELGRTDSTGSVRRAKVGVGAHVLEVIRIGFRPVLASVTVEAGGDNSITLEMDATAQALQAVHVVVEADRPSLADFERRRAHGLGRYYTSVTLDSNGTRSLDDFLRTRSGARFVPDRFGNIYLTGGGVTGGRPCFAQVLRDGDRIYPTGGSSAPPNLRMIAVADLEAIEFYAREIDTPAEIRGPDAKCGTLVIWTKGRG